MTEQELREPPSYGDTISIDGKRHIWLPCEICGKYRWVSLIKGAPRNWLCHACNAIKTGRMPQIGSKHPQWNGGKTKDNQGYIKIHKSDYPFFASMADVHGYIREHRLIMALHLKRCLLPWEVVHHKNGIRDDNRLGNLELLPDRRFHIVDSTLKSKITRLIKVNNKLATENAYLHKLVEELTNGHKDTFKEVDGVAYRASKEFKD